MKTLLALAAIAVVAAVLLLPPDGQRPSTGDMTSTLVRTAEEKSYLYAVETYENGSVNYHTDMEGDYVSWGRAVCKKLDEGAEYGVAATYAPGVPQDAFARAAATFLCPKHIGKLPKLRS